ncbi:DUF1269 domain-containing protein [Aporhodopirellula aestuarii]|uniref:DUF1269 domain-containing protein n=1 Tax=Aporhodopirellula aestuarii TaxID=2950107 RepID=A0ABT0UDA0_9BACT|nr:DUF1269 domain-containing protein [Aporhodopirellula aestuarii]MCM2375019.1 DUF1269 domain-containing protein [Aporhodopirellula aestuarii]
MSKCLIAEYETSAAAKLALEVLEKDHFTLENVSVVSKSSDSGAEHLEGLQDPSQDQEHVSAPDNRSTSLGMLIGGAVTAPIAAGTLIGPFIIAGPLVGMAVGAAMGSLLGGMEKWGVAKDVSSTYEDRVNSGSVLVIVHDVDDIRIHEAKSLLKTTDPKSLEKFELA